MFADRHDAGRQLAARLVPLGLTDPVVLALPRGGVPVATEVAAALDAPLAVLPVRKLGAPGQPELALGALAPEAPPLWNEGLVERLGLTTEDLAPVVAIQRAELDRQVQRYAAAAPPALAGRSAVVVDDGLATGASARAALLAVQRRGPERTVLAVPVAAPDSAAFLRDDLGVEVVAVDEPPSFMSVGTWYEDFHQVPDDEVDALLAGCERRGQA